MVDAPDQVGKRRQNVAQCYDVTMPSRAEKSEVE